MRKNFSFIDFAEYTEGVLQEFIASGEDTMYIQGIRRWDTVEELRNIVLSTTKLKCKIVVRKDCTGFHREVDSFADVVDLYDELYEENLQWQSEYFKPPFPEDLDFWFDDYVYYICLHITKK